MPAQLMREMDINTPGGHLELQAGWLLQSAVMVNENGEAISTAAYQPQDWYSITVPATVIAGLLQNSVYPDPFVGENLKSIDPQSFDPAWWYRREFSLPPQAADKLVWLTFQGINYRANIWLNGHLIANAQQIVGVFRDYRFDITAQLAADNGVNVLAVEVFRPQSDDLSISFSDWNPAPPDGNMGLCNDVFLTTSGLVMVQHPLVTTRFDLPSLEVAHLTVLAEVHNHSRQPITGTLTGAIGDLTFSQTVSLAAGETRPLTFDAQTSPQLNLAHPRLWWPWQYGAQEFYHLTLEFKINASVSDRLTNRFGIRQITAEFVDDNTVFLVNGQRILIRGAAWAPDLFQRRSEQRQAAEFRYVRDLNLNAIRLEGKFEDDHFFDLADEHGILILAGWCCGYWESTELWNDEKRAVAVEALKTQLYRLRIHPSLMVWLNGSDKPPSVGDPRVEQAYLDIEAQLQWPNPILSSAHARPSLTGKTGVKMVGPYEWVPPVYWLTDAKQIAGGAWSFATEISPGPAVPPLASLEKMMGDSRLWPCNETWLYHTGEGVFHSLDVFTQALAARYGAAQSAAEYAEKSQVMAYESHRAMFEAYGANKYTATGVIQFLVNNAWPSMIWHLYDYYLRPGGAYFGAKIALEPLHIQYHYHDQAIVVVNSTLDSFQGLQATATVYNLGGQSLYTTTANINIGADGVAQAFVLPALQKFPTTYFLRLTLARPDGLCISQSTYWLSSQSDVVDWDKNTWYYTPVKSYADFTALQSLLPVSLNIAERVEHDAVEQRHYVTVTNPDTTVAFFVHLQVTKGQGGDELLPSLWQDNYFTLLPGESRTVWVSYQLADLGEAMPVIEVDTWNGIVGTPTTTPNHFVFS